LARIARLAERLAWIVGLVALAGWAVVWVAGRAGARHELARFAEQRSEASRHAANPDFELWSPSRIAAWRTAQSEAAPSPLGVLRIPRLRVEAPILPGTDDWTLNRAVGHIDGTAQPGAAGNAGFAGHRDSFFRALKDIATGDTIEVIALTGGAVYRVEQIWIVTPEDVWVLDPTPSDAITLVTCYPFYFIGSAPQRFIVRAVRVTGKSPVDARAIPAG
jgi:sortase A